MFMPIWASRHNPDITGIGACRLHTITEADALAEGFTNPILLKSDRYPVVDFRLFWELINGKKYPWSLNAWVWIVEFEKYEAGL